MSCESCGLTLCLCRSEGKVMFSASLDSTVIQWSSSFEPYYTVEVHKTSVIRSLFEPSVIQSSILTKSFHSVAIFCVTPQYIPVASEMKWRPVQRGSRNQMPWQDSSLNTTCFPRIYKSFIVALIMNRCVILSCVFSFLDQSTASCGTPGKISSSVDERAALVSSTFQVTT